MHLSRQFEKALTYATRIHGGQLRKKTRIPYIAHILGVAAIAMEYGADETEAIAALLHDAVEDCGGAKRLRDIKRKFGKDVARIVEGCTDTDQTPKPPWLERKKAYVAHVRRAPMPTKLVSASDKLHNVRAILMLITFAGLGALGGCGGGWQPDPRDKPHDQEPALQQDDHLCGPRAGLAEIIQRAYSPRVA